MGDGDGAAIVGQAVYGKVPQAPVRGGGAAARICVEPQLLVETEAGEPVLPLDNEDRIVLRPGQRYRARVSLFEEECGANTIAIRGRARFWLSWEGPAVVTVSSDRHDVGTDQFAGGVRELEFTLAVADGAPKSAGRVKLHHTEGSAPASKPMLQVAIEGEHFAPPPEIERAVTIPLDAAPDRRVAYLHISENSGKLAVSCYHPERGQKTVFLPRPAMSLTDADQEKFSRQVYAKVDDYSRRMAGDLTSWLEAVLDAIADDLAVVIVEHAESRVPWEMLTVDVHGRVLGERALVTRWTSVQLHVRSIPLDPGSATMHKGRVLNLLDRASLHTAAEEQELKACAAERCESLKHFLESISRLPDDVALVFLACHGAFGDDTAERTELQKLVDPSGSISAFDLAELARPAQPPAMVINACHSARLARGGGEIEGFPEFFLAKFARSFLGTLGAVDDEVAGAIGAQLVRAARVRGGVQIAEFLRQLRQQAVREFKEDKRGRRFVKYVSAFMYVFYGSAWDRLELDPAAAPPKGRG